MIMILLHLLAEAKDIEGLVSEHHVLLVVDGGNGQLALGDVPVVQDVVSQQTLWREKIFFFFLKVNKIFNGFLILFPLFTLALRSGTWSDIML